MARDNGYYIYGKCGLKTDRWIPLDLEKLQFGGYGADIMMVQGNQLIRIEPELATQILRSEEGLQFIRCSTEKRDDKLCQTQRKKKTKMEFTSRFESLLVELNSHIALLTKLMLRQSMQFTAAANANIKEISDSQNASLPEPQTNHQTENKPEIQTKPSEEMSLANSSNGKEKVLEMSPSTLRSVGKFIRKNLDFVKYRGQDKVSPDTFDIDDDYCRLVLHKLNPLVLVEKSKTISEFMKHLKEKKESTSQKLQLDRFAAMLGLVGTEKKDFLHEILKGRRKRVIQSKPYCELTDDIETDSSSVSIDTLREKVVKSSTITRTTNAKARNSGFDVKQRKQNKVKPFARRARDSSAEFVMPPLKSSKNSFSDESSVQSHKKTHNGKRNSVKKLAESSSNDTSNEESSHEFMKKTNKNSDSHTRKVPTLKSNKRKREDFNESDNMNDSMKNFRKTLKRHAKDNVKGSKRIDKVEKSGESNYEPEEQGGWKIDRNDKENSKKSSNVKTTKKVHHKILQTPNKNMKEKVSSQSYFSPRKNLNAKDLQEIVQNEIDSDNDESDTKLDGRNSSGYNHVKNRVYTMEEDRTLLDFITKGNNSKLVKGTLVWKDLQSKFFKLTNQARTWQSLKNRYLKYILPNLQYYGLTHDKESLLRSGAYLGDIKKRQPKENSIFKIQPVMSAHNALRLKRQAAARLAQTQKEKSASDSPSKRSPRRAASEQRRRSGRSLASSTPKGSPGERTPTYSEVTRRFFRARARDSSSGDEFARPTDAPPRTRKLFSGKL